MCSATNDPIIKEKIKVTLLALYVGVLLDLILAQELFRIKSIVFLMVELQQQ
jgi:hypothetical protein